MDQIQTAVNLHQQGVKFFQSGDLDRAISYTESSVTALQQLALDNPEVLHISETNLANFLHYRCGQSQSIQDLNRSIEIRHSLMRRNYLNDLQHRDHQARCLRERAMKTGSADHQQEAIDMIRQMVSTGSWADNWGLWISLGWVHLDRFRRTKDTRDLEEATGIFKNGTQEIRTDQLSNPALQRPAYLIGFATCCYERYLSQKSAGHLDASIDNFRIALVGKLEHNLRAMTTFGNALFYRYMLRGLGTDLDDALNVLEKAVKMTDAGDAARLQRLNSLNAVYRTQHLRSGDEKLLTKAIDAAREALKIMDKDNQSYPILLHNIAICFEDRYRKTRSIDALNSAIKEASTATDWDSRNDNKDHVGKMGRLNSLQVLLTLRYRRQASNTDLRQALKAALVVVSETRSDDPNCAIYQRNYGSLLHVAHHVYPDRMDLIKGAIGIKRECMDLVAQNRYDWPEFGHSLAVSYGRFYSFTRLPENLEEAIQLAHDAVKATTQGYLLLGNRQNSLGSLLHERSQLTGSEGDAEEASQYLMGALRALQNSPLERVKAGRRAADITITARKWDEAASCLVEVVGLLDRVTLRSNNSTDHQDNLKELTNLGPLAASVLINAEYTPLESLKVLEKARGVISSLIMDSRSDTSALQEHHPDLHARYCYLREIVTSSLNTDSTSDPAFGEHAAVANASAFMQRDRDLLELESIEKKIRENPGFERFQLALTEKEILELTSDGPLVSYNITEVSSHAFLIGNGQIEILPLPKVSVEKLKHWVASMPTGNKTRRLERNMELVSFDDEDQVDVKGELSSPADSLRSMWFDAVEPVLKALNLIQTDPLDTVLPHIFWIGGGLMSLLPLHAARDHEGSASDNTMSHVVSSYMPTLKALHFSRQRNLKHTQGCLGNVLIVSMPRTPNEHELNVQAEVDSIQQSIDPAARMEVLTCPSKAQVLEKLKSASHVHFACHGSSDRFDPSESALLLGKDHPEPLKVKDLRSLNIELAQVAYLSACSTAELRMEDLVDESIHLSSIFQLAGFSHVIGTLWAADDDAAVRVAAGFYAHLFKDRHSPTSVARALHQAILDYRRRQMTSGRGTNDINLDWIPFIHLGP